MSCMMACTLAHEGRVDLTHARIQIKKHVFGTYPDDDIEQYVCKQCADAPCAVSYTHLARVRAGSARP